MKRLRALLTNDAGAAASEFVLAMPMMLVLLFGAMEAGNYFWSEQKLIQAVRDGSRYAARLNYNALCPTMTVATETEIKNLTRTGRLDGLAVSKLPGWENAGLQVIPGCGKFTSTGIYAGYGGAGAVVTIRAVGVPYRPILGTLGIIDSTYALAAEAHAPVIGL